RKRLLEYDDVMNKQRNVIYGKRNHALFGDRLALDLDNAFFGVAESLVNSFKESEDYEGFKLAVIMHFGLETSISEEDFKGDNEATLMQRLYDESVLRYDNKCKTIAEQTMPVIKDIRTKQGQHIENVAVPFTDGRRGMQVIV